MERQESGRQKEMKSRNAWMQKGKVLPTMATLALDCVFLIESNVLEEGAEGKESVD